MAKVRCPQTAKGRYSIGRGPSESGGKIETLARDADMSVHGVRSDSWSSQVWRTPSVECIEGEEKSRG